MEGKYNNDSQDTQNKIETENPKCNYCGKSFATKYAKAVLKQHVLSSHSGMGFVQCDYCGKDFKSGSLKRHIEAIHEKYSKYPCETCSKTFHTIDAKNNHVKVVHESIPRTRYNKEIKNYPCKYCGKIFNTKSAKITVKEHENNVHLGHGRSICGKCGKSFKNQYLKRHILNVHSDPQEQVLENFDKHDCKICGKVFATKSAKE